MEVSVSVYEARGLPSLQKKSILLIFTFMLFQLGEGCYFDAMEFLYTMPMYMIFHKHLKLCQVAWSFVLSDTFTTLTIHSQTWPLATV